jgi:peptide deformylase
MKHTILREPDARLTQKCAPLDVTQDHSTILRLAEDLRDSMAPTDLGIAAPQVGAMVRMVVACGFVMVNPSWAAAGATAPGMERCLSVAQSHRVFRHRAILAKWTTVDGKEEEMRFEGLAAVVVQHEVDHLDGVTISSK